MWHNIMGEYLSEILERSTGRALDIGCGFGDILEDLTLRGCDAYGVEKDRYNTVRFTPIATTAIRLEVRLPEGFSTGIQEWKIR